MIVTFLNGDIRPTFNADGELVALRSSSRLMVGTKEAPEVGKAGGVWHVSLNDTQAEAFSAILTDTDALTAIVAAGSVTLPDAGRRGRVTALPPTLGEIIAQRAADQAAAKAAAKAASKAAEGTE
jgi:hypothetical protein